MRRQGGLALLAFLVLLGAGGCRSAADPWEDARIEAEVKARLVAETGANLTRLGVVSSRQTVYLSGSVPSAEQRTRAEALTRAVPGVERVVNGLEVRPGSDGVR
jgi:osmotically-inducible protein OsmY